MLPPSAVAVSLLAPSSAPRPPKAKAPASAVSVRRPAPRFPPLRGPSPRPSPPSSPMVDEGRSPRQQPPSPLRRRSRPPDRRKPLLLFPIAMTADAAGGTQWCRSMSPSVSGGLRRVWWSSARRISRDLLLGVSKWLGVSAILLAAARKCGHGEDGQKIPLRPSHVPRGLTWLGLGGNELPPPAAAQ